MFSWKNNWKIGTQTTMIYEKGHVYIIQKDSILSVVIFPTQIYFLLAPAAITARQLLCSMLFGFSKTGLKDPKNVGTQKEKQ